MSLHRIRPDAGYCNTKLLPKGPHGFNRCRYCSTECSSSRRTFCSSGCIHEWKIRTQPQYARKRVFLRDKGRCAICGEVRFIARFRSARGIVIERAMTVPQWEMDHVVPVVEGGGECGLEGLRTLCCPCHRIETAKLAARRAEARRAAKAFA
jgi:5-methylcytosine-specific restriction endonuclease McrA